MAGRSKHPKPEVEDALRHAEANGWVVEDGRAHWGVMYCPTNDGVCGCKEWCKTSISGTPRNAGTHAKQIRRVVDRCVAAQVAAEKTKGEESDD